MDGQCLREARAAGDAEAICKLLRFKFDLENRGFMSYYLPEAIGV